MTITEFILARITEDEQAAWAASNSPWVAVTVYPDRSHVVNGSDIDDGVIVGTPRKDDADVEHIARHDPRRVRAECEAIRRIVELHPNNGGSCDTCTDRDYVGLVDDWPCETIAALASVYADHPDFDPEWRTG